MTVRAGAAVAAGGGDRGRAPSRLHPDGLPAAPMTRAARKLPLCAFPFPPGRLCSAQARSDRTRT